MCNINLFNLLQNNPTTGGTWTQIMSSGNSVVPITNNVINTDNINDGTYQFTYTVSNASCTDNESIYIVVKDGLSNIIMPVCGNYAATFNIFTAYPSYYLSQHGDTVSIAPGYSLSYATGSPTSNAIDLTTGNVNRTALSINTTYTINVNLTNTVSGCTCVSTISLYSFGCSVVTLINTNCVLTYTSTCYSPVTATTYILQKLNTTTNAFENLLSATFPYTIPQGEDGDYRILAIQDIQLLPSTDLISCNSFSNVITAQCIPQMCDDCNLSMSITGFVGLLSAGNLTSTTCTIGNYRIDWYRNSVSPSNLVFSSGNLTNSDPDISLYHPMTGGSAVPVIAGTYIPRIRYVVLDNILYSPIQGFPNSTHSPDLETCLSNAVVVNPSCANGSSVGLYGHNFSYSATINPSNSSNRTIHYEINSTTQYLAYSIVGQQISDRIVFNYINVVNNTSTLLEDVVVGGDVVTNNLTSSPKQIKSTTTIRGLVELPTYSTGNYVEVIITPSYLAPSNSNTNWNLGLKCLDTFECACTLPTSYYSGLVSVQSCTNNTCLSSLVLTLSGAICTQYSYLGTTIPSTGLAISNSNTTSYSLISNINPNTCTSISGTVTYTKTGNSLVISFTNQGTYNTYKSQFVTASSFCTASNSTILDYYNFYYIYIRTENTCGDAVNFIQLASRCCNTPVYNDTTYTITVTFTTVTLNLNYGPCDNIDGVNGAITVLNTSVTYPDFTHTRQIASANMVIPATASVTNPSSQISSTATRSIAYIPQLIPLSIRNCGLLNSCNDSHITIYRQLRLISITIERTNPLNVCENYRLYLKPLNTSGCVDMSGTNVLIYELEDNIQIFP